MACVPFGFTNNNNICYLNSLLQCLFTSQHIIYDENTSFKQVSRHIRHINKCLDNHCSSKHTIEVYGTIIYRNLLQNTKLTSGPQDCHEAYLQLLEIAPECKSLSHVTIQNVIQCKTCNHSITKYDTLYTLFVNNFDNLTSVEELSDYKCDKCHEKTCIQISCVINCGPLLIVTLVDRYRKSPIEDYPLQLNLCQKDYKLIGQTIHTGGHYYAECYRGGKVYRINDKRYNEIDDVMKFNKQATLLIYEFE